VQLKLYSHYTYC